MPMRDKVSEQTVKELVRKFKELRLEKNLSHAKLAEKIGMSDRTISFIESNKQIPSILTCLKICKALEVSLEDLLVKIKN